jgi:hypothetical protein
MLPWSSEVEEIRQRVSGAGVAVSGDRLIRVAAAVVVGAVAAFAAVISYTHIYDLARLHGQRAAGVSAGVSGVAGTVEDALRAAYAASVAAGSPLSQRVMAERCGVSRRKVSQLITPVLGAATSNGQVPAGPAVS